MTLTPAVSYRVNNRLYLGAGLNVMYGYLDAEIGINNIPEARSDGQLKYDDSRWGYGANLGIPVADYGIPVSYKFTGKIHKVTIDVQEMKKADKADEEKSRAVAAHKKALSD